MADRDKSGHFLPGHPDYVKAAGVKAGRPKTLKGEVRDALAIAESAMPGIIQAMVERSTDPRVPANVRQAAAEYLIDRIYGKANQPISGKDLSIVIQNVFKFPEGCQKG